MNRQKIRPPNYPQQVMTENFYRADDWFPRLLVHSWQTENFNGKSKPLSQQTQKNAKRML
jgi:hypothetical protein